jgi:serine/threonine-protein kinase HipA
VKKRILDIARRLPDLAHATRVTFELGGNSHPVLGLIVSLINQRCALTIRSLTSPQADESPSEVA